ncbi:polysaccharide pyruvyl transferase family protein [Ramlibacter sp. AN1015]|uniref:polysaccharide pyruvyl transferase family protein n=1 Tax=Ramlibacter sp. AN1015 TaxID=3133428 RepID=UPI0030C0A706
MARNKIVLYGHFGAGNIGNDSTLEAVLQYLRRYPRPSEVICVCSGPDEIGKRFGIKTLPISGGAEVQTSQHRSLVVHKVIRLFDELRFWLEYPRWFEEGDKFIVVGTGAADDLGVIRPWNAPYELYKWCKAAKMGGAQVVFLSVGVGPIVNRMSRVLMLGALRMAHYRSYRETAAFDYLRRCGFDTTEDRLYPDLAFSLVKELPRGPQADTQRVVVGLGLINYRGWHFHRRNSDVVYERYIAEIKRFVGWLLQRGTSVRLFSGDLLDLPVVHEIKRHFDAVRYSPDGGSLISEPVLTIDDLLAQIAQTDIVVASRFHNVLSALLVGVPVISLGYHDKNRNLMGAMGLEKYCQDIERFTFEHLVRQFESYGAEREQAIQRIHKRREEYRCLLDEQYRIVLGQCGRAASNAESPVTEAF